MLNDTGQQINHTEALKEGNERNGKQATHACSSLYLSLGSQYSSPYLLLINYLYKLPKPKYLL